MARGFLSGVIAGTLVSGLGLAAISVLSPMPVRNAPEAASVDVPAGSEFNQSREDTSADLPEAQESPDSTEAPEVTAPEPDDLASLDEADTTPAAQPETGAAEGVLATPGEGDGAGGVAVEGESPVLPSPQSQAPEAPEEEEDLSISTDPAQPSIPEVADEEAAFPEPSTETAKKADPADKGEEVSSDSETDEAAEPSAMDEAPEMAVPEPDMSSGDMAARPATEEETIADNTNVLAQPEPVAEPKPDPELEVEVSEAPAPTPEPEQAEVVEEPEQEPEGSSTIGNLAPEVETNRLPSVGDPVEPEAEPSPALEVAEAQPTEEMVTPLQRYAAPFENPQGKPLMAIVLIDDGSSPVGLQALESFPYPLNFAVKANWPGAKDAMARYRAAGFEVLAMTDLPDGASAKDTEVAMQVTFAAVPEAVAIMEGTGSGLQSSRAASEQLAPILLDSGHGVILFPKGLNTAQKLLAREGVPSAAVFRDFDAKGQNATVIRRFLDQAAFKAGQEDAGVVMVGRLRPDTVSALLLWGLQDRAGRVALAPVSALLDPGE